jgi:glycosyltransferase involved in cell wall biosynthesis
MTTRSVIILTLNEIEGCKEILPRLPLEAAHEWIAVDGGSTDGTRELLQEHQISVIDQNRRGRGEAFRVGVQAATGEHLLFFSPDGNEDPADIPGLFALLDAGNDLAIGSRFLPGARNEEDGQFLPLRKWVNQAFSIIANMLWNRGVWVTDTINGYRAINREVFEVLNLESAGYTIEYEMTIKAFRKHLRIAEMPTCESNRIGGGEGSPSLQTGIAFLKCLARQIQDSLYR